MKSPSFFVAIVLTLLSAPKSAPAQTAYIVQKANVLSQHSNSAPTGAPNGTVGDASPYYFHLEAPDGTYTSVTGPNGNYPLTFEADSNDPNKYKYSSGGFASQSAMDAVYPDGNYTFNPGGPAVTLTGDVYPNAPQLTAVNGAPPVWDAQGQLVLNPGVSNTLTWSPFAASNANYDYSNGGHISIEIGGNNSNAIVDQESFGLIGQSPFNTYTIAPNALTPGVIYPINLDYDLVSDVINAGSNTYDIAVYQTENFINAVAASNLPGTVDLSFDPGTALTESDGTFSDITALGVQSDGKVLVATSPTAGGQTLALVRLNADGTLDSTFNATITGTDGIFAIAFESNGHIVIGGNFSAVDGTSRNYIAVLNPDGTLDTGFDPGSGANAQISSIVVQASGNIVIGGYFTSYNGVNTTDIARLTPAGALDATFQSGAGFGQYNSVNALIALPNGQLLVGGSFTTYHDTNTNVGCVVRLNGDGSLDASFNADSSIQNVYSLAAQSTGQAVANVQGDEILRLDTDGSLDQSFATVSGLLAQVVVEAGDQILLGGNFYYVDGIARSGIARLDANGALDTDFDPGPGANGQVQAIALGANSEVFVAGAFNGISNANRTQLALLYAGNLPGSVQFSASTYSVNEDGGSLLVLVQRIGGGAAATSVSYTTADGTAVAGTDYTATSGTLNWAEGDLTPKSFTVPILDASIYGGSKYFSINLGSPTGGLTLGLSQAQALILDSDPAPQPAVTLTSPPADISAVTGSTVALSASVADPGSILSNVQFTVNGASLGTITGAGPYVASVAAGVPGTYTISAVATDTQGRVSTSSHVLTVLAADPSNPAPAITLLTDINNRKFGQGATIPISINAVSGDGSPLASVTFYADGVPFATIPGSAPASARPLNGPIRKDASATPATGIYQANYQLPANTNKIINLLAVALSKLGVSQSTPVSSIEGISPSVDQAPLVALDSITSSTQVQVGQTLNIPATVSDPDGGSVANVASRGARRTKDLTANSGQIARMEYFVNQLKVKDSAQQPFGFTFTPAASGQYIVDAIATDGSGVSTVSAPVTVTAIAPPVVSLSAVGNSEAIAGGKKGKVLFTRSGGDMTLDLNVHYKVGGTAVNGADFQLLSGTLLIPAGQTSAKLKITPIVESPQAPRKVTIKLLPATDGSYTPGSDIKVKLQLIDNE